MVISYDDSDASLLEVKNNTIVGNSGSPTVSLGKSSSAKCAICLATTVYTAMEWNI